MATLHQGADARQSSVQRAIAFVCISNDVLLHPPVRPRNSSKTARLSVFEFAILAASQLFARKQLPVMRHIQGRAEGKRAMKVKRAELYATGKRIKAAGSAAYHKMREARPGPNSEIQFTTTRSALLRHAGFSNSSKELARVEPALDRLCRPVLVGKERWAAPLHGWREVGGGKLEITVSGVWSPGSRYTRVPMPLPAAGPVVLALYLFLWGVDTSGSNTTGIAFAALCKRIGISTRRASNATQTLTRALHLINAHLDKLPRDELSAQDINIPSEFEIIGERYVRFWARPYRPRNEREGRKPDAPHQEQPAPQNYEQADKAMWNRFDREILGDNAETL